jgi:sugar/nucleoside kinase (ribokinase family)
MGMLIQQPKLLFVGLTTLDIVHRGVAPAGSNHKVTADWQGVSAGGPAANAAVVAAALGAEVHLLTALGASPEASIAKNDLLAHGVKVTDVATPEFQFPVSCVLVDTTTGERSVVSLDGGTWAGPTSSTDLGLDVFPDAVMFDGHHANLARRVAGGLRTKGQLADRADSSSPPRPLVILDCGRWRPVFADLLPLADVAAASSDFQIPPEFPTFAERGLRSVVVTNGPDPVQWTTFHDDEPATNGSVPVPEVAAKDTLGAGDAWHGAFTYYLARGESLPAAIAAANQIAATRVQHLGNRNWLTEIKG